MSLPKNLEDFEGATVALVEYVDEDKDYWHYVIEFVDGSTHDDYYMGTDQFREFLLLFLDEPTTNTLLQR